MREIQNPTLTARELIDSPSDTLLPMLPCTDCNDLYEVVTSPAHTMPSNRALSLYISALREDKASGRVKHWTWLDTRDMLANPLTKLNASGCIEWNDLQRVMTKCKWHPAFPYKVDRAAIMPPSSTAKATLFTTLLIEGDDSSDDVEDSMLLSSMD